MFSQAKLLTGVYQNGRRHIHDPVVSHVLYVFAVCPGVTRMKGKCLLAEKLQ